MTADAVTLKTLNRLIEEMGDAVELRVVTNHMTGRRVVCVTHANGGVSRITIRLRPAPQPVR